MTMTQQCGGWPIEMASGTLATLIAIFNLAFQRAVSSTPAKSAGRTVPGVFGAMIHDIAEAAVLIPHWESG